MKMPDQRHSGPVANQSPDLHKERMVLHTELNLLLTKELNKAEQKLLNAWRCMYEHGDKASHVLAQPN